jgi:hypothetical protein
MGNRVVKAQCQHCNHEFDLKREYVKEKIIYNGRQAIYKNTPIFVKLSAIVATGIYASYLARYSVNFVNIVVLLIVASTAILERESVKSCKFLEDVATRLKVPTHLHDCPKCSRSVDITPSSKVTSMLNEKINSKIEKGYKVSKDCLSMLHPLCALCIILFGIREWMPMIKGGLISRALSMIIVLLWLTFELESGRHRRMGIFKESFEDVIGFAYLKFLFKIFGAIPSLLLVFVEVILPTFGPTISITLFLTFFLYIYSKYWYT